MAVLDTAAPGGKPRRTEREAFPEFVDAVIIGAGIAGMYQLHQLCRLGMSVRVFETGSDVGGTWYWNRYPGARFDSESWTYGYSFSEEVLEEWNWSEHFSAQPETLRYLNFVADKFDLRRDISFNSRVAAAHYQDDWGGWNITLDDGRCQKATFLITAIGPLSAHTLPRIDGIDDFQGTAFHTARWPHHPVDLSNKRVGVIGTGATGIQTIQTIAKSVGHLSVFQRTANWAAPLHNTPISAAEMAEIKANYPAIFARCRETPGCFIHMNDPRATFEVSEVERLAFYEELYNTPGFGIWQGNFRDMSTDPEANAAVSAFIADKIRQRVKDPVLAEKLIPKDHGFGTRRVPLETGYFEVYNQANVRLVDLKATPIERITATGLRTSDEDHDLDVLIYATGFDALTGGFDRIDIRGRNGLSLKEKWADGPRTFLGLQTVDFPNMLTIVGPHNAAARCNIPRCIEQNVEWVSALMGYMRTHGHAHIEATQSAEDEWTESINELAAHMLYTHVDSWMTGVNRNVEGKDIRRVLQYQGGAPAYREHCEQSAAAGYAGFELR